MRGENIRLTADAYFRGYISMVAVHMSLLGMCGFGGYFGSIRDAEALLSRMIAAIAHRGPDENGKFVAPDAGLGHARLSVVGIGDGQQPMSDVSGDLTIAFNGEIFNYVELREGLLAKGRHFRTSSDTEVILQLYDEMGEDCLSLLDDNLKRFAAQVPTFAQWDDHEVVNNWYPGEILDLPQYTEKRVDVLAQRAFQAFHEWMPIDRHRAVDGRVYRKFPYGRNVEVFVLDMRTYKDKNTSPKDKPGVVLGAAQAKWLVDSLARSTATWKIIAADLPIGLTVPDGTDIEGVANGLPGAPNGREHEIAWVLRELKKRRVRNTVWLTADVHYTAAHHYSPERAAVGDFDPFWEFVSGPLHSGAFGPNTLDPTFGPEAVFVHAPPAANTTPLDGFQHFGEVEASRDELTVWLRDATGASLWTKTLRAR